MTRALLFSAIVCIGCGSDSPMRSVTPTPVPVPSPAPSPAPPTTITVNGTITDTVSGAAIGTFSQTVSSLPASVTVSAPGHITRQTRVGSTSPIVDLIPSEPPFSSIFYGQLVRNMLEGTTPEPVRVLPASPSLYIQTTGLSSSTVNALAEAARAIVPALTGGKLSVVTIETGDALRPNAPGWITVELVNEPDNPHCGRSEIGALAGHVWLNTKAPTCIVPSLFQHELGHALGFWHIDVPNSLMNCCGNLRSIVLTDAEKYHAAIAYHRQSGNRDPDIDASTAAPLSVRSSIVVVD